MTTLETPNALVYREPLPAATRAIVDRFWSHFTAGGRS